MGNPTQLDLLVIGGGIGGCAMTWVALQRGLRVGLVDKENESTSSKVAAGLVTPITGARLAPSWRFASFFGDAIRLYEYAESVSGIRFFHQSPALRIFSSEAEAELFRSKWLSPSEIAVQLLASEELQGYKAPWGGFLMTPAARLSTCEYLEATRLVASKEGFLARAEMQLDQELIPGPDGFSIERLGVHARWVCLAQGVEAWSNKWYRSMVLHPARGDILEVTSTRALRDEVAHRDGWIVPLGQEHYLIGATYLRGCMGQSEAQDTELAEKRSSREELLRRWQDFFDSEDNSVEVVSHRRATRPASFDRHPLIGPHPEHPNLVCLNGLGSKGALMAPKLAMDLLDYLSEGKPIDPRLRWDRRTNATMD